MSRQSVFGLIVVLAFSLMNCGSVEGGPGTGAKSPSVPKPQTAAEKSMVKYLAHIAAIGNILGSVTDKASAQSAAKKFDAEIAKIKKTQAEIEKCSEAEIAAAARKYSQELTRVQMEMSRKIMPVMSNPEYAKLFGNAMSKIPTAGRKR
jgi:hypothetical protein